MQSDQEVAIAGEIKERCQLVVPDWSVVTLPAARRALDDLVARGQHESRMGAVDAQSAAVLAAILKLYAADGRAPSFLQLETRTGLASSAVRDSIDLLRRLDLVVTGSSGESIVGAYPFTDRVTGHNVMFARARNVVAAMCAIDALGAGAMCRQNATIASACGYCGRSISAYVENDGKTLLEISPEATTIWINLSASRACAADTVCTKVLFFCCAEHLQTWLVANDNPEGHQLSPQEAFQVGMALFIRRAEIRRIAGQRPTAGRKTKREFSLRV